MSIGTYGKIRCYETSTGWRATTYFCDFDGRTRPVERTGKTKAAAERNLKAVLTERSKPSGGQLTADTRVKVVAELWFTEFEKAVRKGLPDLSRFMMATGVRIGEALGVWWEDVDLDAGVVAVDYIVIRILGVGLTRKSTKTEAGSGRTAAVVGVADAEVTVRGDRLCGGTGALGGLRDPANARLDLRGARRRDEFAWVTSHVFRKTAATILDEANLTARLIADQLGHSRPSMTQGLYLGRKAVDPRTAEALNRRSAARNKPGNPLRTRRHRQLPERSRLGSQGINHG
ncbi:hypothetical protein [Saccharothrix australiensis]|uniref:hypothetical protein n=1 Tax=Saccharothrix australiensis TaxID=2072 RepID=UPI001B873D06|nr:hypothetical protein [Saccharothrix australiensis]